MTSEAITGWLEPLRPVLAPVGGIDWRRLEALDAALDAALIAYPVDARLSVEDERSRRLRVIRWELAQHGHCGANRQVLLQLLAQFVCGYRDLDLRDATGLGHGEIIARHGSPQARQRWIPRLQNGELAGIAITESHGGSRPAATRTRALPASNGTWLVSGRKTWISRLTEAAVFVVFFRDPNGQLAAAAIDASHPALHRQPIAPTGLAGWTWGTLDLDAVPVHAEDVLHGDGMALFVEPHLRVQRSQGLAAATDRPRSGQLAGQLAVAGGEKILPFRHLVACGGRVAQVVDRSSHHLQAPASTTSIASRVPSAGEQPADGRHQAFGESGGVLDVAPEGPVLLIILGVLG